MTKATGPRPITELLNKDARWRGLLKRAGSVSSGQPALPQRPRLPLPAALDGKVDATLEDGCLTLMVANNAIAQVVRFHGPRLAAAAGATRFQIRVGGHGPVRRQAAPVAIPRLPAGAAALLQATAAGCDHPRLAAALARLAEQASESE